MTLKFVTLGLLALVQVSLMTVQVSATHDPKTVCYYEYWVHYREGNGKMDPSDIDSKLCTHLVYAYFGIEPASHELKILDPWLMTDSHDIDKFARAKGSSKALISVGGASASDQFSITAGNDHYRDTFVRSVVSFLSRHNFDGIIIDWYGMPEADSQNLIKLLDKFDELFATTPYTLAITLPVTVASLSYYNVPKISQYVDFINVITYDYAGSWSKTVGNASPLSQQLATLEEYHKRGAPRSKLLMSVPLYARTWKLVSADKQEIGDAASGPGTQGPYTKTDGLLSYNELCVMIKSSPQSFSIVRDPKEHAVHAIHLHGSTAEFITFEDTKTLAEKAKIITEQGYAGMTVMTLSNEDVHGLCGKKYPLLQAINDHYFRGTVTEAPVVTIPPPTTERVTDNPKIFRCHAEGNFRDPVYCYKYHHCEKGELGGFESTDMFCDRHQAWDNEHQKCVDAKTIPGC